MSVRVCLFVRLDAALYLVNGRNDLTGLSRFYAILKVVKPHPLPLKKTCMKFVCIFISLYEIRLDTYILYYLLLS